MKTYDEIVSNVVQATASHRRKVKKIQQITATSVMCAVCVFGLSVYMNLEPQQTLPSETETQTVTETETADIADTAYGSTDIPETTIVQETARTNTNQPTAATDQTEAVMTGTQPESGITVTQPETEESIRTEESAHTTAHIATETQKTTGNTTVQTEAKPTTEKPHTTTRRPETGTIVGQTTSFDIPNIDQTGEEPPTQDTTEEPPSGVEDPDFTDRMPYTTTIEETTTTTTTTTTAIPAEAKANRTVGTVTVMYRKETV